MAHWYIMRDGAVRRYVQYTKDGREATRINKRRAIADGAVLGLTDTLAIIGDAAMLIEWAAGIAATVGVEVGFEYGMRAASNNRDRMEELFSIAMAHAGEAYEKERDADATRGTLVHESIDAFLAGRQLPEGADDVCRRAAHTASEWLASQNISGGKSENCVLYHGTVPLLGKTIMAAYGGTIDYVTDSHIVDWKTINDNKPRKPKARECAQLAGYRLAASSMGITSKSAKCVNIYIGRDTGNVLSVRWWSEDELAKGLEMIGLAVYVRDMIDSIEAGEQ